MAFLPEDLADPLSGSRSWNHERETDLLRVPEWPFRPSALDPEARQSDLWPWRWPEGFGHPKCLSCGRRILPGLLVFSNMYEDDETANFNFCTRCFVEIWEREHDRRLVEDLAEDDSIPRVNRVFTHAVYCSAFPDRPQEAEKLLFPPHSDCGLERLRLDTKGTGDALRVVFSVAEPCSGAPVFVDRCSIHNWYHPSYPHHVRIEWACVSDSSIDLDWEDDSLWTQTGGKASLQMESTFQDISLIEEEGDRGGETPLATHIRVTFIDTIDPDFATMTCGVLQFACHGNPSANYVKSAAFRERKPRDELAVGVSPSQDGTNDPTT